ncbi:MAG: protein kinase [Victivallaceae bacterium]
MNSLKFKCPHCSQKLEAEATMFGEHNSCPACGEKLQIPDSRLASGIQLDDFVLRERIGSGGMGEVWLAEQQSMGRQVALKIMRENLAETPLFQKRFLNEVKNSGSLMHPNIVTAFHAGCDSGIHYMAMEFIEGVTLQQRLLAGPVPEPEALQITLEVAVALDYAWRKFKIIHRDIKPANIMLTPDGAVKLLDMGIARTFGNAQTNITTGTGIVGTPHYMSPEQAVNEPDIDCRCDIYALGIVLCEMLTGKPPFNAPATVEVIAQHIFAPRPDLHASAGISLSTSALVTRMLDQDRNKRFPDWQEVIQYIKFPGQSGSENATVTNIQKPDIAGMHSKSNQTIKPPEKILFAPEPVRRKKQLLIILLILCAVLLTILIFGILKINKNRRAQAAKIATAAQAVATKTAVAETPATSALEAPAKPPEPQRLKFMLKRQLELSDKQVKEVHQALEESRNKGKILRQSLSNEDLSPEERQDLRQKLFQTRQDTIAKIKNVLTAEQFEQYRKFEQNNMNRQPGAGNFRQ